MAKRGQNEGTIYKRADSRWEARISLGDGKRKSHYAKTRAEAARWLASALRERDLGLPVARDERQTVAHWLTSWLAMVKPTVKPKTYRSYEQLTRVHLIPGLGRYTLTRLAPQHVQALWAQALDAGKSPTTVHHLHAVLHKALDDARRLGLVQRNVTELVDPPRVNRSEMHVLTKDQAHRLLEAAHGDRLEALYVLAIETGMREGELLALRWRDADLERRSVQVRATLQAVKGGGYVFAEPKTKQSRRKLTISRHATVALKAHRTRQLEERIALGPVWEDVDLVFCNTIGRPLDGTNLLRCEFYPLLKRAALPQIRFHDLRHTAATLALLKGMQVKLVSDMLAHASTAITSDLYQHVTPDTHQQIADAMDELFGG